MFNRLEFLKTHNLHAFTCMLVACTLGVGCASTNSNGRRFQDMTSVHVVPVTPSAEVLIIPGVGEAAVAVGVALAKYAIKAEAKKYEATSEASLLWRHGFPPTNAFMVAVIRTLGTNADFKVPNMTQEIPDIVKEANDRLSKLGYTISQQSQKQFEQSTTNHDATAKVSMIALLLAHPGNDGAMYFTLLGYYYPVLKAKNSMVRVPFANWHKTESVLSVTLGGAQGFSAAAYKIQRVVGPRVFFWPRADKGAMKEWRPRPLPSQEELLHEAPGIRSVPYAFPKGPVEITATVVESSEMKKTLEQLGDAVGKLKLGDFKK